MRKIGFFGIMLSIEQYFPRTKLPKDATIDIYQSCPLFFSIRV